MQDKTARPADEIGDAIALWLEQQGLSVIGAHSSPRNTRALAPGDLPLLGKALRHLHGVLARHPQTALWRNQTEKDLLALSATRAKLASGELKASPYYDGLADLARDEANDFVMLGSPRIACHMGEARIDTNTGTIVFLDFQNVPHAYLPAPFELARVIERQLPDLSHTRDFLKGYGVDGRLNLVRFMKARILRACCALAPLDPPADQWQKIFDLYALIQRKAPEIDALET